MEGGAREIKALIKVWLGVIISIIYTYSIVSKLPKGKTRFFSLLPIFSVFTLLPLSLSTATTTSYVGFFYTALANAKLILFSFDLGPLSHDLAKKSFINFLLIATFPIKIKRHRNYPFTQTKNVNPILRLDLQSKLQNAAFPVKIKNPSRIQKPLKFYPLNFWYIKILLIPIFVAMVDIYNNTLHSHLVFVIYCCIHFLLIDVMLDTCNKLVGSIIVVDLCQPSDEPYLSTSLQEFWGYRWNLVVTDTLRHIVYKPMMICMSRYMGQQWAPIPAMLATFLVSGLMHELLFYFMTRVSPSWEMTWFFVLHGLCVVLEVGLKKALGRKLRLHWVVSGPLTVGFVMVTAYWWFFPPIFRNEVHVRITEEVVMSLKTLTRFIMRSFK